MVNEVILSGKIEAIQDVGDYIIAVINTLNDKFYLALDPAEYDYTSLERKYVCARGYLQHLKLRLKNRVNCMNILAIWVEDMEECEV